MVSRARDMLDAGIPLEAGYAGPVMDEYVNKRGSKRGKITQRYVDEMREWFQNGKTIARRHVWEIVLGAYDALSREPSLVEVTVPEEQVCDVVGDTHGQYFE